MADRVEINISRIKIAGVGGLGMLAMVAVIAYAMPQARQFVLTSYGAGIVGAFLFIAYRRWIRPERPHRPTLMMVNTPERTGDPEDRIPPETHSKLLAVR
jgi:hypothetical protein